MSQTSTHLNLPYIQPAQAQKHVTHNEAIELLDMIVQLTVQGFDATIPTTTPSEGETWALGEAPTGIWTGEGGKLATWRGGGWLFVAPQTGWRAYGVSEAQIRVYDGANWATASGTPVLENLSGLGVNATSDSTNKLAVASDATLFSHAGAGHQLKLNKATPGDTASLLYQSNWSGRAEMGLAGDDDFAIKVSADGTTFTEALRIDATSGAVSLPASHIRQMLPYQYRHYLYTDHRWTAPSYNAGSLNAVQSLGTGTTPIIDYTCKGIYLAAGTQVHRFSLAGSLSDTDVGDLDMCLFVQHGPWGSGWSNDAVTTQAVLNLTPNIGWTGGTATQRTTYALSHTMVEDGYFLVALRANPSVAIPSTSYAYISGMLEVSVPQT